MNEGYVCEECVHDGKADTANLKMPSLEQINQLAQLFKMFADPTRVRILSALSSGELCVCDIAEVVEMSSQAVSQQLRVLKSERLVRGRREGKMVYYSLDDDHVMQILKQGFDHVLHK